MKYRRRMGRSRRLGHMLLQLFFFLFSSCIRCCCCESLANCIPWSYLGIWQGIEEEEEEEEEDDTIDQVRTKEPIWRINNMEQ